MKHKTRLEINKQKDPHSPLRPRNAFSYFFSEQISKMNITNKPQKMSELLKQCSQLWKEMPRESKLV